MISYSVVLVTFTAYLVSVCKSMGSHELRLENFTTPASFKPFTWLKNFETIFVLWME